MSMFADKRRRGMFFAGTTKLRRATGLPGRTQRRRSTERPQPMDLVNKSPLLKSSFGAGHSYEESALRPLHYARRAILTGLACRQVRRSQGRVWAAMKAAAAAAVGSWRQRRWRRWRRERWQRWRSDRGRRPLAAGDRALCPAGCRCIGLLPELPHSWPLVSWRRSCRTWR